MRGKHLLTLVPVVAMTLTGCSAGGGNTEMAEALYEACTDQGGDLIRLDGSAVLLEVLGQDARDLAEGSDVTADDILAGDMPNLGVAMSVLAGTECLAEATGYPGNYEQLRDGEDWNGWEYSVASGTGSESTAIFRATANAEVFEIVADPIEVARDQHADLGCTDDFDEIRSDPGDNWTSRSCHEGSPAGYKGAVFVHFDDDSQREAWEQFWRSRTKSPDAFYLSSKEGWGVWGWPESIESRALELGATSV
ncbi:hypothetical protein C8046_16715 [Serinibacter arcticus]|uniref:Lipoprotein n=1 Tax=Serinibacter arcticus TaxID=1655435 RepID=A0A2U1ZYP9_9MICO|nr:hypothetical protein [Serinibacter arcticus]PWD52042.1 hypothetical protein C8046_16715 [Serinibacter arcticus]